MKYTILLFVVLWLGRLHAQLEDITVTTGINHQYVNGAFLGGGIAFTDYDNDGWQDLAFTGGEGPDRLFRNLSDGTFEDVSDLLSKHDPDDITTAVLSGDLNNDGCDDLLFLTYQREAYNLILRNNCDGTYSRVQVDAFPSLGNSMAATFYDFDGDGLLDIYIGNYIEEIRNTLDSTGRIIAYDHICDTNQLWINQGNFTFTDVTERYGVAGSGCTLATTVIPLADGRFSLMNANDFGPFLYPNEAFVLDRTVPLIDEAPALRLDKEIYGMGIAIGDIDDDQDFDLYVANLGENVLHVNNGATYFDGQRGLRIENTTTPDGKLATSWGTFFFDMDSDTDLDLLVANGTVNSADFVGGSFDDPNILFIREGRAYRTASSDYGISFKGPNIHRGAAMGDLDNDGDLDVVIAYANFEETDRMDRSYKIYLNETPQGNFLKVDIAARRYPTDAFGTKLCAHIGDLTLSRYQYSGGTHASQNELILHFGLGDHAVVDSLVAVWPDGQRSVYHDIEANQTIQITDHSDAYDILGCTDPQDPLYHPQATLSKGCQVDLSTSAMEPSALAGYHWDIDQGQVTLLNDGQNELIGHITTASGQVVAHIPSVRASTTHQLKTAGWPTGVYIYYLSDGTDHTSGKIFVP